MKVIQNIVLAALCGALLSCGSVSNRENSRLMQEAQRLIQQKPDSALALLQAVDVPSLSNSENAEYTLLLVQAKDKAGQDITADTAVFAARDFFVAAENDEKAAFASFYAGRGLQEQGNTGDALKAYLEAGRRAHTLGRVNTNFVF